jgi:hypothetical protein
MALQLEQQQQQLHQQQEPQHQPGRRSKQHQRDAPAGPAPAAAAAPGLGGCLSPQQLEQCRAAWLSCGSNPQDNREPAAPDSMPTTSSPAPTASAAGAPAGAPGFGLQRKVFLAARQLQGLTASPRYEAPTSDGLFSIDIAAQTATGVQLAIEVDGPSHFRLPDMALTGTTLFRNRQLAARGYVVVSVPYTGWNAAVATQRQTQGQWLGSGQQLHEGQQQQLQPLQPLQQQLEGPRQRRHSKPLPPPGQQQQQQQQQGQGQVVTSGGQKLVGGLLGVQYLQGLVDAAVLAATMPRGQCQPLPVSSPSPTDSSIVEANVHPVTPAASQSGVNKGHRQDVAGVVPTEGRQGQQAEQAAPSTSSANRRQGQLTVPSIPPAEGLPDLQAVQQELQGDSAVAGPAARGAPRASRRRRRLSS